MRKMSLTVGETTMIGEYMLWRESSNRVFLFSKRSDLHCLLAETPFPYGVSRECWHSFNVLNAQTSATLLEIAYQFRISDASLRMELVSESYSKGLMYSGLKGYHEHHGGTPNSPVSDTPKYMFGVELETEFFNPTQRTAFFRNFSSNYVYAERDGSLNDERGAEFITVPLCPKDAKSVRFWRPLCECLSACGCRSFSSPRTGLHVHVSRSILGEDTARQDETIGRLLYLYFYVLGEGLRKRVFGRGYDHYNTQLTSSVGEATKVLPEALRMKEVSKRVEDSLKGNARGSRYYSINLTNSATIEFRDGKGSISAERLSAIVEFCEILCLYARTHKIHEMSENSLVEYAKNKMRDDSALYNYINEQ